MDQAYPWDRSSLKSMSLDLQHFKKLDAYALKVNVRNSIENLVSVLLREAHNDIEKVRAIWMWTCHNMEYDVDGFHDRAKVACIPADVLQSRKSICCGYAALFAKMCSIAGIECKKLSGYAKGYSYKIGNGFQDTNHTWNSVYLDGRWHLLDSTWGSGSVNDSCTQFICRYNEFYFLTHPALFINDHFPKEHKWQLLKQTLTLQQFEYNLWYKSAFYSVGLVAASPNASIISTDNGKATVLIESHSPALFQCNMNGIKGNCLIMLQRNGVRLEVYPQQTGTHSLQIFAKAFKDKEANYSHVLEYSLKCSSVDKNMCLPQTLLYPVGPSWHTEENGILKALPTSPIIHTDDGRCNVTFTRSTDLDFFVTLESDTSIVPEDRRRHHIWKTCREDQVELKIHLPHAGNFALHIWAKKRFDPGDHDCALSYLLSSQNKNVKWPVFPQYFTNWEDGYELVEPLAGILPSNSLTQFKLKLPGIATAWVQCGEIHPLTLSQDGFWEGACHTSGGSQVTIGVSKSADSNVFWSLLEYKVESHEKSSYSTTSF
ncbi:kyphoscoliosis peptidase-like isoform X2 [Tiliqua scincoides]|uniref:kyphoscoliosis peptidase-like isoform X2 n=1 Tax=Tiliqua scincoides TaxID=71010 RepID=UPI003462D08F